MKIELNIQCRVCGKNNSIIVDKEKLESWKRGEHIQHALSELTPAQRELLISGTCDNCWNKLFPEEEEEEI